MRYLHDFGIQAGSTLVWGGALSFASALTDGIGFLLLLPVLQVITNEEPTPILAWVLDLMRSVGVATPESQLAVALSAFLCLIVMRNLIVWRRTMVLARLSQSFVDHWRMRIFRAISHADWAHLLTLQRHEGQHAMVQDVARLSGGTYHVLTGSVGIILVTVQVAVSAYLAPALTLLALVVAGVGLLAAPWIMRRARRIGQRQTQSGRTMHEMLTQFLAGLKLIKVHNSQDAYDTLFFRAIRDIRADHLRFMNDQAVSQGALQIVSAALLCVTIMVGLFAMEIAVSVLITVVIILSRTTGPLFRLFQSAQMVANMLPAYEALEDLERQMNAAGTPSEARQSIPPGPAGVTFRDVSFRFPEQQNSGLHELSFDIAPGQMVALVGSSGVGKTTVLDLMTGLLVPDAGRVTVAGVVPSEPASRAAVANTIGYASQDPLLFDISLRRNLTWDGTVSTPEAVHDALSLAGASELVAAIADGLETRAGDRGTRLSGGERQRICLARTLLRNPSLLILDEATSMLDQSSERAILGKLAKLTDRMTVVIVTHRTIDLTVFDQVIDLDRMRGGQTVEQAKAENA
ncbi:MAG: ABC transporter ATP-binding protein [Halieaceae bacterium]|nr:ABC transporter ATP-binding protein [Halieaceae bacterium]